MGFRVQDLWVYGLYRVVRVLQGFGFIVFRVCSVFRVCFQCGLWGCLHGSELYAEIRERLKGVRAARGGDLRGRAQRLRRRARRPANHWGGGVVQP